MIKRTLYFSKNAYLHTKDRQLIVRFSGDDQRLPASIPIEDIGVVVLDGAGITLSQTLLSRLLDNNVAVIVCNERHMPQGLLLNLEGNTLQQERFSMQIKVSVPLKKQLWQQTIKAKITNQRLVLENIKQTKFQNMQYWADSVRSGDSDNHEARAAAFYWGELFKNILPFGFIRKRFGMPPNMLLNYGYAILRAITARALVASGLLPTLGIHHHNKYNAYALADDIMEPYRPYVDALVYEIVEEHPDWQWLDSELQMTTEMKTKLLKIPVVDVIIDQERSPLMIAMQHTTTSLVSCFSGRTRKLLYPVFH